MRTALSVAQVLAVLAVLVGVALALPLWASLVVDGALVLVAATAAEYIATRRPSGPSNARSGPNRQGVG